MGVGCILKNLIAGAIITFAVYLSFEETIVKKIRYKGVIEVFLLFVIILCCMFNLVLITLHIGAYTIQFELLSIILLVYLYIFFIMYKKGSIKKESDKKIVLMLICLTLINIYIFFEPIFLYIYSPESYSLYLFTYLNIELLFVAFLILKRFNYGKQTVINVVSVFSLMNCTLGFFQFLTGKVLINFKDATQSLTELNIGKRISGFVIGDNGGGNLGAILLPILLYKYKKDKNILNFSLIVADLIFTIFTFTRIAYTAICVEFLIFIALSVKISSIKEIIINISTLIFTLCAGMYIYFNYMNQLVNIFFSQRGDTELDRFTQFPIAIKAFFSTPLLGTGHGQYNSYIMYKLSLFDKLVIHSQFLNMIVEDGIFNTILFLIFNICLIYMLLKKYTKKIERLFIIILVIGNLICINFNPNQTYQINIYIYYFILFGFLFAKDEIQT